MQPVLAPLANLDIDVLRTLAVATDLGGFAKAAERLGRSQSAVSLQMRRLEERVGRPLFRKEGRRLALTESGDVILGYARRILELNDEALAVARGIAVEGAVRFGGPQDFGETWLPRVLARFRRAHPAVMIEARVDRANRISDQLADGSLDLALLWGAVSHPHAFAVGRLPMAWIGRKDFVRAKGEAVPLALFDMPCVFRAPAVEALKRARIPWRLAFTSSSLAGLWAAAEAGLGLTIRTALALPPNLANVGSALGLPKLPDIELALVAADAAPSPAVLRLREILLEELAAVMPPVTAMKKGRRR